MFANRFTVVLDACVLVPVLKRNILLSLAEAEFFRARWSARILSETGRAIEDELGRRGVDDAGLRASKAVRSMQTAFAEAQVEGFEPIEAGLLGLPDADDAHVVAAAVRAGASMIVTDNLRHFPHAVLDPLGLEVCGCDVFIADTIDLEPGKAIGALRTMRERFAGPELDAGALLRKIEGAGMLATADALLAHLDRL